MDSTQIVGRRSDNDSKKRFIINDLRYKGQLSRREIATRSGLSPATVSGIVADLLEDGLVIEEKAVKSPGGRRPTPVRINYDGGLAIGIKLNFGRIEAVLTDMSTTILASTDRQLADQKVETVLFEVEAAVRELMAVPAARARTLHGVGVAIPGAIDTAAGVCRISHRLGWRDVAFAERLSRRLDVPVRIDDDSHAFALAQSLFGIGLREPSFATLAIGDGISVSMVLDGRVYRGAHGAAGKLGHVRHASDGRRCECGRAGCLQALHAFDGMVENWRQSRGARDFANNRAGLVAATKAGEPDALAVVGAAGKAIGQHLATFINIVDLRAVVVGGEAAQLGAPLIDAIRDQLATLVFDVPPTLSADCKTDFWRRGAAALVTQMRFGF